MLGNDRLAAMAGGTDPGVIVQQMIADAGSADPRMAMVAQLLAAQQATPASDGGGEEIAALTLRLAEAEATIEAMKRDGRRLIHAHQACRDRLGELAAALGACGLCWGDDTSCPSCRGRGRPGMVRPDIEVRTRLLGPPRPRPAPVDPPHPNLC
jgi:hypothetical protein